MSSNTFCSIFIQVFFIIVIFIIIININTTVLINVSIIFIIIIAITVSVSFICWIVCFVRILLKTLDSIKSFFTHSHIPNFWGSLSVDWDVEFQAQWDSKLLSLDNIEQLHSTMFFSNKRGL